MTDRAMTGTELMCRRRGLGMDQDDLAYALESVSARTVRQVTVSRWETGERDIPPGVRTDLESIEASVDRLTDLFVASVHGVIEALAGDERMAGAALRVPLTDEEFWSRHPDSDGLPVSVVQVAAARAQRRLASEGVDVPIWNIADPA